MNKVLEIKHVSKTYGSRIAVNDISLEVFEGEIFGFLGANGAGKTTLIKAITGLSKQDSGEILICGKDILTQFTDAIRNVGAIIENPDLYPHLSGYENLRYFASYYEDVTEADIWWALQQVNMQSRAKEKLRKYSLGMKQRVGIAQAIMSKPRLLVLDEPTNGLDPTGIKEIRDLFKKLAREQKITIFISSHILSEMQLMCDRVAVINNGELLAVKSVDEILHTSDGKQRLCLSVDDNEKAIALIKERFEEVATVEGEELRLTLPPDKVAQLNATLVEEGIAVKQLRVQERTLEETFIDLTKGNTKIV